MYGLALSDLLHMLFRYSKITSHEISLASPLSRKRLESILSTLINEGAAEARGDEYVLLDLLKALSILQTLGIDPSPYADYIDWSDFESYVASILEDMGFETHLDVRNTSIKRFQIDVLGIDPITHRGLIVECKHWSRARPRALQEEAERLVKRSKRFVDSCEWIAVRIPSIRRVRVFIPVIVSIRGLSPPVVLGIPVVEVFKLRDFVENLESYVEELGLLTLDNRCFCG